MSTSDGGLRRLQGRGACLQGKIVVAGPCSVESEHQVMEAALQLGKLGISALRGGIWKPRTRPGSFQGIGEAALPWLKAAGKAAKLPVACEVAQPAHVDACLANGIDVLWIGARTTVNPFSVQALADRLRGVDLPVMVKNPVNPDLELWMGAIERLRRAGVTKIIAIHRGFSTARETIYRNEPIWRIPLELRRRMPEIPLLCDPSHMGGTRELLKPISQEALDLLYDGLMIEVHPHPDKAQSDRGQQITPSRLRSLLASLKPKKELAAVQDYLRHMAELRKEVDGLDHQLLDCLSRRMEIVRQMSHYKAKYGVSSFQPHRWSAIVKDRTRYGTAHALDEDFVLDIFEHIHEEAIRQQEQETDVIPPEAARLKPVRGAH
ncbi:MAG: bifunctional 3-deoxy-7-phosphoheptulonate synthase/chorismate mutase type II [Verrucomicrobia bacterium]|nr:bifunctional 3-deoxy-7-phosphoheptulonate synthase/chorismate mutase type II [Verrucomicrobiota bacterium]